MRSAFRTSAKIAFRRAKAVLPNAWKPLVPITTAAALISSKDPGNNMDNNSTSTSLREAVRTSRQPATAPSVAGGTPSTTDSSSTTMRAATASELGRSVDDVLDVVENFPKVEFDPADPKNAGYALVRVQACALAPGDVRVLSGRTREVQGPPAFPYVPGGDVCGVVEAVADGETFIQPGDTVVSQFHVNRGGLAEYTIVKTAFCARKPPRLTPSEAAATASSGAAAVLLSRNVKPGDRVLVLGGSGGVGTFLVQLLKLRGASFVAATSTQTDLMRTLGVDRPIDYTQENVWDLPEFQSAQGQFDLVFDLAAGGWENGVKSDVGRANPIIKSGWQGGRFVATVGRTKWFDAHSWFDIAKVFVFPTITKMASTWLMRWSQPRYKYMLALGIDKDRSEFRDLFDAIESGDVQVILHGGRPYRFTTEEVREAFRVQESGHAHGKVVVQIE